MSLNSNNIWAETEILTMSKAAGMAVWTYVTWPQIIIFTTEGFELRMLK